MYSTASVRPEVKRPSGPYRTYAALTRESNPAPSTSTSNPTRTACADENSPRSHTIRPRESTRTVASTPSTETVPSNNRAADGKLSTKTTPRTGSSPV